MSTCRLHGINPYEYIKDLLIRVQTPSRSAGRRAHAVVHATRDGDHPFRGIVIACFAHRDHG